MSTFSAHVLDSGLGTPAAGIGLVLTGPGGTVLAEGATGDDGRYRPDLVLAPGEHALVLATGAWFDAAGRAHLHPSVTIAFTVAAAHPADRPGAHLHVALLLGPWSYTTYRGS